MAIGIIYLPLLNNDKFHLLPVTPGWYQQSSGSYDNITDEDIKPCVHIIGDLKLLNITAVLLFY